MLPTIFAVLVACFVLERLKPGWWTRVLLINGVQLGVVVLAGFTPADLGRSPRIRSRERATPGRHAAVS